MADPNPEDPHMFNGWEVDHISPKIVLNWTKGYPDKSTRLHNFEVRPCKFFKIEMWGKPKVGKRRARDYKTLSSVEELKDYNFKFDDYDYRINSDKWIVPKPANPPKELKSTKPPPSSQNRASIPSKQKEIDDLVETELPGTPRCDSQTSPRNVIKKIGSGACESTKCRHCKLLPTGHYCVNLKKGSNTFFSDNQKKEICGVATCFECRSKFGDKDGKTANYCISCSSEMKKLQTAAASKKRKGPAIQKALPIRKSVRGRSQRNTRQNSNKK